MTEQLFGGSGYHRRMSPREIKQLQQQMKKNYARVTHIQKKAQEIEKKEAEEAEKELLNHIKQTS